MNKTHMANWELEASSIATESTTKQDPLLLGTVVTSQKRPHSQNGLISTFMNEITQLFGLAERSKSTVDVFFLFKIGAVACGPLQLLQGKEGSAGQ